MRWCRLKASLSASLSASLLLAVVAVSAAPQPPILNVRKPLEYSQPRVSQCVRPYDSIDGTMRFLINTCDRIVYVGVQEQLNSGGPRRCAVFGLEIYGYGKAYGRGETFLDGSIFLSYDAAKSVNYCERTGYELVGGGIGQFMRVDRDAPMPAQRQAAVATDAAGAARTAPNGSDRPVVQARFVCNECDDAMRAVLAAMALEGNTASQFVSVINSVVTEIHSMINRELKRERGDRAASIDRQRRRLWRDADDLLTVMLTQPQYGLYESFKKQINARVEDWRDYVDKETTGSEFQRDGSRLGNCNFC